MRGGYRARSGGQPGNGSKDHTYDHIVATEEVKRRRGCTMHPMDILEIYRCTQLNQEGDPEDDKEKQRRELVLWQTTSEQKKEFEDRARVRLQTIQIRHDLLEAVKKEKELQFKQKLKPVEEEKPVEPVLVRPILVTYRRKKKRESIW